MTEEERRTQEEEDEESYTQFIGRLLCDWFGKAEHDFTEQDHIKRANENYKRGTGYFSSEEQE